MGITNKKAKPETDSRGVRYDSPWYPHTVNCMRRGASLTNPQPCECGDL